MKRQSHPDILVLLATFLVLALPLSGWAQFTFITNADNTLTITGYSGNPTTLTIPSTTNGYNVVGIGDSAFYYQTNLSKLTFIGSTLADIGDFAFYGCINLTNLAIPDSVTNIGIAAFGGCVRLSAISVDVANQFYCSSNGVLFDKALTKLIQFPAGMGGNYTVPTSVVTVAEGAFDTCANVMNITMLTNVTHIGDYAFYGCSSLTNLVIPNGVDGIGNWLFQDCTNLAFVAIPNSVTYIGDYAFEDCYSLASLAIPNSVTNIGAYAFFHCRNLASLTLSTGITNIGTAVFYECTGLTNIVIPNSVKSINTYAFHSCSSLKNVTIPNSVNSIGSWAFADCSSLTSITIPASVNSIGDFAFSTTDTGLTKFYFLGNAPTLGAGVFVWLTSAPGNVTFFHNNNPAAVVYYLPGTTGWGSTYGTVPTKLWNPQIQATNGNFGIRTNQFGFNLTGTANIPIVVESSTNLNGVWTPLLNGTLTNGSIYFSDSQWTNYPKRFYRIRSP